MNLEEKLLKMKKDIEEAKSRREQAKGALESLQKRLKVEFNIDPKNLDEEIELLDENIEKQNKQLEKAIMELEEKWPQ